MKILHEKLTNNEAKQCGLASLIYDAIIDEWEAIKFYDSIIATAESQNNKDIVKVIEEIRDEETVHVGQLQQLLTVVGRDNKPIADGEKEAKEQLK